MHPWMAALGHTVPSSRRRCCCRCPWEERLCCGAALWRTTMVGVIVVMVTIESISRSDGDRKSRSVFHSWASIEAPLFLVLSVALVEAKGDVVSFALEVSCCGPRCCRCALGMRWCGDRVAGIEGGGTLESAGILAQQCRHLSSAPLEVCHLVLPTHGVHGPI